MGQRTAFVQLRSVTQRNLPLGDGKGEEESSMFTLLSDEGDERGDEFFG